MRINEQKGVNSALLIDQKWEIYSVINCILDEATHFFARVFLLWKFVTLSVLFLDLRI